MPDPLDAVMQAAERQHRIKAGEPPPNVYAFAEDWLAAWQKDDSALADFALSILPKGKRPVARRSDEITTAAGSLVWTLSQDHHVCRRAVMDLPDTRPAYSTREEAELEAQYRRIVDVLFAS